MKTKRIIALVAILMCTTAFAQTTRSERSQSSSEKGWNSIYASYNMLKYSKQMFGFNKAYNGLSIGYDRAFILSSKLPLYMEIGGAIQYAGQYIKDYDWDDDNSKITANLLSVKVPVSVLYRWNIHGSKWSIVPKAGLDGRWNIVGVGKDMYDDEDWSYNVKRITDKYNMFKGESKGEDEDPDDGLYGSGAKCNRFQAGWHIGVNVEYNSLLFGIAYTTDINAFCRQFDAHFRTLAVTIGYRF